MSRMLKKTFVLIAGIATFGFCQSASADFSINNGKLSVNNHQDIVITLKSNPAENLEEACLAVTFARMLSMNPDNNVTLFVTLDGVSLEEYVENEADEDDLTPDERCKTPPSWEPGGPISLENNLHAFLNIASDDPADIDEGNHQDLVVCPICWNVRYPGDVPDYGVLPGNTAPGDAIATMIGNADKILDF